MPTPEPDKPSRNYHRTEWLAPDLAPLLQRCAPPASGWPAWLARQRIGDKSPAPWRRGFALQAPCPSGWLPGLFLALRVPALEPCTGRRKLYSDRRRSAACCLRLTYAG